MNEQKIRILRQKREDRHWHMSFDEIDREEDEKESRIKLLREQKRENEYWKGWEKQGVPKDNKSYQEEKEVGWDDIINHDKSYWNTKEYKEINDHTWANNSEVDYDRGF